MFKCMQKLIQYLLVVYFLAMGMQTYAVAEEAHDAHDGPSMIFTLGPVLDRSLTDKKTTYGSSVGLEFTAIEHQLEIEVGAQYLSSSSPRVLGGVILFKKPFELSHGVELEIGLGPSISRKISPSGGWQSGITFSPELMIWPTKKIGWYISPEYNRSLGKDAEKSVGLSIGLLFPL